MFKKIFTIIVIFVSVTLILGMVIDGIYTIYNIVEYGKAITCDYDFGFTLLLAFYSIITGIIDGVYFTIYGEED